MAIGGDIPPELLRDIVLEACEDAYHGRLLDPFGMEVPNRKEAIKNITACSLTCVYWAQICRQRLFSRVEIKNYEDMCAYTSLVSSTPTGLVSISEYARAATLVQRVEERPWLHLVRMQPSLFRFWLLRRVHIRFHIVDSPEDAASSQRSTLHRLFASLPRTLFSSCLQCSSLIIANSRFVAPQDLSTFLQKCQYGTLSLTDVTWDAQTCLDSDSLTTDPLNIPSTGSRWGVQAQCSKYSAETAWLAFTTTLRYLPKQVSTVPSLARYGESKPALQVLPSTQRTILDICKSLCQGRKLPFVYFVRYIMPIVETPFVDILPRNTRAYLYYICSMAIREYETARESGKILHEISLAFYKSQVEISGTNVNDSIVVDHISVICAQIKYFRSGIGVRVAFPWEEVVRLCAAQPAFTRLQLLFLSHDQLVQFMETQRAALDMLNGRISIFYNAKTGTRAADYETLADIGDAKEHAYVHSY